LLLKFSAQNSFSRHHPHVYSLDLRSIYPLDLSARSIRSIYPLDLSARFYTAASATLVALPLHNGDGAEQLPVQDKRADRCM